MKTKVRIDRVEVRLRGHRDHATGPAAEISRRILGHVRGELPVTPGAMASVEAQLRKRLAGALARARRT